ncbi:MAG: beta-hydroxyacyl-ACP dehydratase [Paludibacteraceae bacterium]|nr:beta-hydroxyacyl-ACP dehydratase [Paludibacteraceae bacterium]
MSGKEIERLLPQRPPILMIDQLIEATEHEARTALTIVQNNIFCVDNNFREPGIIEHIAQSASALAGYNALCQSQPAPVGYIGEVKKFHINRLPKAGDTLQTHLQIVSEVNGVSLLKAETMVETELIASGQLKIFIE